MEDMLQERVYIYLLRAVQPDGTEIERKGGVTLVVSRITYSLNLHLYLHDII